MEINSIKQTASGVCDKLKKWKNGDRVMLDKSADLSFRIYRKNSPEKNAGCHITCNISKPLFEIALTALSLFTLFKFIKSMCRFFIRLR